jgi:hypothetical protein
MDSKRLALKDGGVEGFFFWNLLVVVEEHLTGVSLRVDVDEKHLFALVSKAGSKRDAR